MALKDKATKQVVEIPEVPEITAKLYRAAQSENRRNQYRGRIDRRGTVRVRVYSPLSHEKQTGEILVGNIDTDATAIETSTASDGTELAKVEFDGTLADNVLVVMWAPADAEIEGIKVLV